MGNCHVLFKNKGREHREGVEKGKMTGGRLRKGRGEEKKAPQKVLRLRARDVLQDIKKIVVPRRETVSRRRGETQDTTDTRTFSSVSILALYIPIRQRRHENHSPTAMYKNPVPPLPRAPKTTAEVCSDVKAIQNYFLCTETPPRYTQTPKSYTEP